MLIRVGFSADPDDAFMFWGLASGTVDPQGFEFEPVIHDIQTLNEWALEGRLEVTAMSLATYPLVHERYALLAHGASIGAGYPMSLFWFVRRSGDPPAARMRQISDSYRAWTARVK